MSTLTLTLDELVEALDQASPPTLVEALSERQFAAGHLPGAINLPRSVAAERAAALLPDLHAEIVVYCRDEHCVASREVAAILTGLGYTRVCEFPAGKIGWRESGRALISDQGSNRTADPRVPPTACAPPASIARRPGERRR